MVCVAGETAGLGCLAEISRRGENEGARGSVPDFPGVFACVFSLFLLNTGSFFRLRNAVWVCANDFIIGVAFVSSAGAVVAGTAAEASVERISLRIALNPASMFNLFSSAGDEPVSGRIDVSSDFSGFGSERAKCNDVSSGRLKKDGKFSSCRGERDNSSEVKLCFSRRRGCCKVLSWGQSFSI